MLASAIRELAVAKDPLWVAAAFFEKTVQIWDLKSQVRVSEFSTVFCGGAGNLAIAPSASVLLAGLSRRRGKLAAYQLPAAELIWQRTLSYPSSLRLHPSGKSLLCSSNDATLHLDIQTGNTLEVFDGMRHYIAGPYGHHLEVPANGASFRLRSNARAVEIPKAGFALLDARFSPSTVCLAEARGPVRCISYADGQQRWKFDPGADSQVLLLHYSPTREAFFGIQRDLTSTSSRYLLRFDHNTGACERICQLDSWEEVFVESTDQLITSSGDIRNLSDGALEGRFAFPVTEYPDT
jgi:WD40 repeat protein